MSFRQRPYLLITALVSACFLLTAIVFGIYYGWLDDVIFEHNVRGFRTGKPIANQIFHHRGLSHIYVWLYQLMPNMPWYGLFLLFGNWLACFFAMGIVYIVGNKNQWSERDVYLNCGALFLLFFLQSTVFVTYTLVALQLSGFAFLFGLFWISITTTSKNQIWLVLTGLVFAFGFGYLIRYKPVHSMLPILIMAALFFIYSFPEKRKLLLAFTLLVALFIGGHQVVENTIENEDSQYAESIWPYILSALDGQNFDEAAMEQVLSNPEDSIRYMAVAQWFFYDQQQIDTTFFQRISHLEITDQKVLTKWKAKLAEQYERTANQYAEEYRPNQNWRLNFWLYLWLSILLYAYLIFQWKKGWLDLWQMLMLAATLSGFWALMLLVSVSLKMEGRYFLPLALVTCFFLSASIIYSGPPIRWRSKSLKSIVQVLAMIAICYQCYLVYTDSITNHKTDEIKQAVVQEINEAFKNKLVFLDFYTAYSLHNRPWRTAKFDEDITFMSMGNQLSHNIKSHRDYIKAQLGTNEFLPAMRALVGKGDEVVVISSAHKVSLLEGYFKILYKYPIKFEKISEGRAIEQLHYSFLPYRMDFGYYRLTLENDSQ